MKPLTPAMVEAMEMVKSQLERDPSQRVVLLAGRGYGVARRTGQSLVDRGLLHVVKRTHIPGGLADHYGVTDIGREWSKT